MYTLTLSHDDRRAFNFVGHRYFNGDAMADILNDCIPPMVADHMEWSGNYPITFEIPENRAWAIADLATMDDNQWPLFAPSLASKMQNFVDSIV